MVFRYRYLLRRPLLTKSPSFFLIIACVLFIIIQKFFFSPISHINDHFYKGRVLELKRNNPQTFDSSSRKLGSSWYHNKMTKTENFPIDFYEPNVTKRILYWTDDYSGGHRYYGIGGLGAQTFRKAGCPIWQCEAWDYLNFNTSGVPVELFDAVVFHDPTWYDRTNRPTKRLPEQRYIFWNQEAPTGHFRTKEEWNELAGFFNWAMTYRWDSDIIHPYGWITPAIHDPYPVPMHPDSLQLDRLKAETSQPYRTNYALGKTKLVTWFVSNCNAPSGRLEYVNRLSKFIQVDVYGKCGNLNCSSSNDDSCRRMMERTYKFYLAFENSLCFEYVTEKLFRQLHYDILPVVLDLHGNYAKFAPPHSYINALDYPSVEALANYLVLLDQNDTLYNEYFWWKGHYVVHKSESDFQRGLCRLCSLLHEPKPSKTSFYDDLTAWWDGRAQCKSLRFLRKSSNSANDPFVWTVSMENDDADAHVDWK